MAEITLPSTEVASMCQRILSRIEARRETEDKKFIDQELKSRNFWRAIFFLGFARALTWDEVKKDLDSRPGDWYYPSIYAWGTKGLAESILRLTKLADTVTLIEEDLASIK